MSSLTILRASRLEALVAPLEALLAEFRPEELLEPQTVMAAHPGMKQWLGGALARQAGPGRIVANLDIRLPSDWLDGLAQQLLGKRAVALPHYRRGALRWTLYGLLLEPEGHGISDRRVLDYLRNGAAEPDVLRFQLADRLARVYSQYLIYRGDWLQAWQAGKWTFATRNTPGDASLQSLEAECLGPLWQATAGRLGKHRAELMALLQSALATTDEPLPPLHAFGLSHLAPVELDVLQAYAQRAPVFLYVPDPCREYWGGLHRASGDGAFRNADTSKWDDYRQSVDARLADPDAIDWHDQDHPLLARWGRMGQHFFAKLADVGAREDTRHWQDEQDTPARNRLERLQESIRQLEPALMDASPEGGRSTDPSLRIHACHTRLRELEVLRDALLDAFDHDGILPGQMVVMAPDIRAYLPLIPAVFGEAGSAKERLLPYHLADVPVASSHPLLPAFDSLLGIATSRITAPEVVDLLRVAEVRRALGLADADADTLTDWLQRSHVAWALDGGHKQALSLPDRADYSFAWAVDRMLAGYVMGDAGADDNDAAITLPDATTLLPQTGIAGPSAAALGSLDRLLRELQAWRDLAGDPRPAGAWAELLRQRVETLLRVDPADTAAVAARTQLERALAALAEEPAHNDENPILPLAVARELLRDALAEPSRRQRFLMGGITFCGMVPQRAIPFPLVAVLGLDDGAFPRRPADGGVDLMTRLRRLGDRDVPGDDRYLFLETVMSARKRLHLSYVGQSARDGKSRNPAAPLAELQAELMSHEGIAADAPCPWLVQHPLQPFNSRYFDASDPALFTYSHAFAAMTGDGSGPLPGLRSAAPTTTDAVDPHAAATPDLLPLRTLEGWFKDPAKALLNNRLHLTLDALDDDARLPEDEPLDGIARLHAVARRVFLHTLLPQYGADPDGQWDGAKPAWLALGGLLPPGEAGETAWQAEAAAAQALLDAAAASGRFDARCKDGAMRQDIDLLLPECNARITGTLHDVYPLCGSENGLQLVVPCPHAGDPRKADHLKAANDLDFKRRVPAFLRWALLRLRDADGRTPVRLTLLAQDTSRFAEAIDAWDRRYCAEQTDAATRNDMQIDLRRRIVGLVQRWRAGSSGHGFYYPSTGWAVLKAWQKAQPEPTAPDRIDALSISDPRLLQCASKARGAWVADYGNGTGERDYAPGYARLLEGALRFGDIESDPEFVALKALLKEALALEALIQLPSEPEPAEATP